MGAVLLCASMVAAGPHLSVKDTIRDLLAHGGDALPKPSAVVMAYTGHSEVVPGEPPTFAVAGERDGIAPPAVMEKRVAALRRGGADVEYHKYPGVGHGFGPGVGTSAEGWIADAVRFWTKHIHRRVDHQPMT